FFEQTAINSPTAAQAFVDPRNIVAVVGNPTRVERSVPLKALVSQINYNLFDLEVGAQQQQFAYLQAKDLADSIGGLMLTHDSAIYSNPILLDLLDQELKTFFNVVLSTSEITGGLVVKKISTQAGDLPLIPDWSIPYTGTPGSGTATLPAYIVTEDMVEYHWLTDTNPDRK